MSKSPLNDLRYQLQCISNKKLQPVNEVIWLLGVTNVGLLNLKQQNVTLISRQLTHLTGFFESTFEQYI